MVRDPTFNRRKYPRVMTESLVSVGRIDAREALAHALDLSVGGLRFQCVGLDVRLGDMLKVTITLGERTMSLIGQLVRVDQLDEFTQEVALVFLKMEDETRQYLECHLPVDAELAGEDERRGYARIQVESMLAVAPASLIDVAAQARDLSLGGVSFVIEGLELELGETLRVALKIDGATIEAIGQAVRVTEMDEFRQEIALAFFEIDSEALEILKGLLPHDGEHVE